MQIFYSNTAQYGGCIDTVGHNGRGVYSGKTKAELEAENGPLEIIESTEGVQRDRIKKITEPTEITAERYDDMLNVLPPCKWRRAGGGSCFHVSERITHDIVSWFVCIGDRYFELQNSDRLTNLEVITLVTDKFFAKDPS